MNATAGRTTAFDLAGRLRAGATVQAGWMGIGDPIFAEIVALRVSTRSSDMQHGDKSGLASLAGSDFGGRRARRWSRCGCRSATW